MNKRNLFLKIAAICVVVMIALSFAACGKPTPKPPTKTEDNGLTPASIKQLADLPDYSKSAADYNAPKKSYSGTTYDGKDCSTQIEKLQNRIDQKTEDVYFGKTESAVTKIFTKSTPQGILTNIANAGLTYDEMVRVVNYIAGDKAADVDSYIKEVKNNSDVTTGWTGTLTANGSSLTKWTQAGTNNEDLNKGWSFFDDWELYDRLKEYAQSEDDDVTGLQKADDSVLNSKPNSTKAIAGDNASWQYRSILQKVYTEVDLDGAPAARLATWMLLYAVEISESMSNGQIEDVNNNTIRTAAFSQYFRTKVPLQQNISPDLNTAKGEWNPYAGLGDYNLLSYMLAFHDFYTKGYSNMTGVQPCAQLYGYYYLYNRTYYNVALADKTTYGNQLRYEKLDTYTNGEWSDYVAIQRNNYTGSYRYKEDFYQNFYKIHFDFQARKESYEGSVYGVNSVINGRTYTGEMQKAINNKKNGIKGQLALSDWMWCYGGDSANMKAYNDANTKYQEGKQSTKEAEYEGKFDYEFQELNIAHYLFKNMTKIELSGALYYNCYAYSGSLISEMQGYSKDIVLINDGIKSYDKFTSIPAAAEINESDYKTYANGKLDVLRTQAKNDWTNTSVDTKADNASAQQWGLMCDEIEAAQKYNYKGVKSDDTQKGDWEVRCEYLEDRVIARLYSCCGQRISEADLAKCDTDHAYNKDGTAVTKDYDTDQQISKFASEYEPILLYVAGKAQVEFQTPTKGYKTSAGAKTYNVGYYGDIEQLIADSSTGSDVQKMTYDEIKTFTIKIGADFDEEVVQDKGDDGKWWSTNSVANKENAFGPKTETESAYGSNINYTYTYEFKGWFLDEKCKYLFNPKDDIDFDIIVYAGYKVTKAN